MKKFQANSLSKLLVLSFFSFEVISSQPPCQRTFITDVIAPSSYSLSPSENTEALCKDLASAIQSVVISKMRRSTIKGPIFGASTNNVPNVPNTSNTRVGPFGAHGDGCQCQMCTKNWNNVLARVVGMPASNSNLNNVGTVPVPLSAILGRNVPLQDNIGTRTANGGANAAVLTQNIPFAADLVSNLVPLSANSVPNVGTKYELVILQNVARNPGFV